MTATYRWTSGVKNCHSVNGDTVLLWAPEVSAHCCRSSKAWDTKGELGLDFWRGSILFFSFHCCCSGCFYGRICQWDGMEIFGSADECVMGLFWRGEATFCMDGCESISKKWEDQDLDSCSLIPSTALFASSKVYQWRKTLCLKEGNMLPYIYIRITFNTSEIH